MEDVIHVESYPLLFSFHDFVACRGFMARVAVDGQVVLTEDDDGSCWLYGVRPGGLAATGDDRGQALLEFKRTYQGVLFDIAARVSSLTELRGEIERFVMEENGPTAQEWQVALVNIRAHGAPPDHGMPIVPAEDRPPRVSVDALDEPKPEDNVLDELLFANAA